MITSTEFMENLEEHGSKRVFYFYGEEGFLTEEAVRRLRQLKFGVSTEFNTSTYYGDEAAPMEILDALATLSLGSTSRWVLVKRADELSTAQLQEFLPYLQNPSTSSFLVFIGGENVDARREFFKKLAKIGCLVKAERLKGEELKRWIVQLAKKRGHALERGASELIELLVGRSLFALEQAIERLSLSVENAGVISCQLIQTALTDTHEGVMWSLTEALGKRDVGDALRAFKRILRQKDTASPVLILGTLAGYYRRLLFISLGLSLGQSEKEIASLTHLSPGALYFNKSEAQRWQADQLQQCMQWISLADRALKSSGTPPELILSDLLLQLCRVERKASRHEARA